jgi:hypothetical protein
VKKFYSISLAFLVLLGGMHITFATHYCGGKIAASKISFSGELASCGMEGTEASCPLAGDHLKSHCCDDEVSLYAIDNTYTSSFTDITDLSQNILQVFNLPESDTFHLISYLNNSFPNVFPPGKIFTSAVSLVDICVFRN